MYKFYVLLTLFSAVSFRISNLEICMKLFSLNLKKNQKLLSNSLAASLGKCLNGN